MRRKFKIFNYTIEISNHARHKWSHFKIHDYGTHKHLVWGRLAVIYGRPDLEEVSFCACCESPECREIGCGDESWTVCPDCGAIEQGYLYLSVLEAEARGMI